MLRLCSATPPYLKMKLIFRYATLAVVFVLSSVVYNAINLGMSVRQLPITAIEEYMSEECNCSRLISVPTFLSEEFGQYESMSWCSHESSMRGYNQNVISYSLNGTAFNDDGALKKYFTSLNVLPRQIEQFYPGWRMRIYHNFRPDEKGHELLCDAYCRHDNVDLCNINQMADIVKQLREMKAVLPFSKNNLINTKPVKWRYLSLLDPLVDRFMARDLTARIIAREKSAVDEWLSSERTFHVMRDHQDHADPIMGGMFGAKVNQRRSTIRALMKAMIMLGSQTEWNHGQNLLTKVFWPIVKDDAIIHDSYHCGREWNALPFTPFPTRRVNLSFVSNGLEQNMSTIAECPVACRPPKHLDWDFC